MLQSNDGCWASACIWFEWSAVTLKRPSKMERYVRKALSNVVHLNDGIDPHNSAPYFGVSVQQADKKLMSSRTYNHTDQGGLQPSFFCSANSFSGK